MTGAIRSNRATFSGVILNLRKTHNQMCRAGFSPQPIRMNGSETTHPCRVFATPNRFDPGWANTTGFADRGKVANLAEHAEASCP